MWGNRGLRGLDLLTATGYGPCVFTRAVFKGKKKDYNTSEEKKNSRESVNNVV